jgi:SmpA/OmlA family protein
MRLSTTLLWLSCSGLLGGCATGHSLVPGQSTEADVRARMGAPTDTRVEADGDRVWEYARGREGFHTYMVRIGPDGRVKEVTQVLTEERLARIVPGKTTRSEVRRLLGPPSFEDRYGVGQTWSWRYKRGDVHPGHLVVTFNRDDTVSTTIAIVDSPRGP